MATPLNQLMPIESALTPTESQWFKSNAPHFLEALRLQQTVINQLIIRAGGSGSGSTVTDLSGLTAQVDALEEDYVATSQADLRAQMALDAANSIQGTSAVIAAVDFGASFTDKAQLVVTGESWVTANSCIVPQVLTPTGVDPDEMYLLDFEPVISDIVPGDGFTVTIYSAPEARGAYNVMCLGV